jgi:predicted N-acetyltransferase YhbS
MNVEIRKERVEDQTDIYNINKCAFGREDESKLINRLRQTNCLALSLIARMNGSAPVAHIAFRFHALDLSANTPRTEQYSPFAINV